MSETTTNDLRAPMPSAAMKYNADGSVNWGDMWDSYCLLAQDGGPPHRETLLEVPVVIDVNSLAYRDVAAEIKRGIYEVTGLTATEADEAGWISVRCISAEQAHWMAESMQKENVTAKSDGSHLFVPVGENFTLKGEIKNVITGVAKTHHYWLEHLDPSVKQALRWETRLAKIKNWLNRRSPS